MPWSAPRTWVTGELVTSTIGNAHWRDQFLYLQPAMVRAYKGAASQAIAPNSATALTFDGESYDDFNMHSAGTPTRVTIVASGVHRCSAAAQWSSTNSTQGNNRYMDIMKNGTTIIGAARMNKPGIAMGMEQQVFGEALFAAGDYVEARVSQDATGFTLDVLAGVEYTWIAVSRIAG